MPLWAFLPLYLKEGGLVPLLRPTIDNLAPTSQPEREDSLSFSVLQLATDSAAYNLEGDRPGTEGLPVPTICPGFPVFA